MRRLAFVLALLALSAASMVAALPALAAPENGNSATDLVLDCGVDGTVTVLVQFATGSAAVFDTAQGNGRQYAVSSYDDRAYAGDWDTEPSGVEPDFAFAKTWGTRNGYGGSLACSGRYVVTDEVYGTFTGFFDVVLAFK